MDTLCGIGLPELIILALLGFILIGPERSREVALTLGRWLGHAMKSSWWKDITQIASSLRDMPATLVRLAELEEAQAELQQTLREIEQEAQINPGRQETLPGSAPQVSETADPWGIHDAIAGGQTAPPPRRTRPAPSSSSQPATSQDDHDPRDS